MPSLACRVIRPLGPKWPVRSIARDQVRDSSDRLNPAVAREKESTIGVEQSPICVIVSIRPDTLYTGWLAGGWLAAVVYALLLTSTTASHRPDSTCLSSGSSFRPEDAATSMSATAKSTPGESRCLPATAASASRHDAATGMVTPRALAGHISTHTRASYQGRAGWLVGMA